MLITKNAHGSVMVIHLGGKFEGGPDRDKLLTLTGKLIADGYREIVFSFLGVRFLASNGVGIMIAVKKLVDAADGRVILCNLNERALSVMYIMRLQDVFILEANIRTALQRMRALRQDAAQA